MQFLVIDGKGGRLGKLLIESISREFPDGIITAVGTNAVATATMLKAGAHEGATGENPALIAAKKADVIVGPIGIVIADSLLGEITAEMAVAIARSPAVRVLIPVNRCDNLVAGVNAQSVGELAEDAVAKIREAVR